MNLHSQEFTMSPYEKGNGENTVDFLKYLQAANKGKKLVILWNNASYHCSKEVRAYLGCVDVRLSLICTKNISIPTLT
jgi:transposase